MRHILFVIGFCFIYSVQSSAQGLNIQHVKNPDGTLSRGRMENEQKTGLWVTYDSQGRPKRLEEYQNGQKHGYFMENDEHSRPFMEGWFDMGKPVGKHTVYKHGSLIKEMDFDTGLLKEYYENGTLKKEGKVKDGVPDGTITLYYESGKILSESNYANGKKNGIQKYYYQSGILQVEYNTKNDAMEGLYKEFHDNGKPATEGIYENNMKQGVWKEYDETGKLIKQTKYKNDQEVQ